MDFKTGDYFMKTSELAAGLAISAQMCNRLKKRGMPCDSLQNAIEWRKLNLDATQTKSWRIDRNQGTKPVSTETTKDSSEIVSSDMAELIHRVNDQQLDLETKDADELFRNARECVKKQRHFSKRRSTEDSLVHLWKKKRSRKLFSSAADNSGMVC